MRPDWPVDGGDDDDDDAAREHSVGKSTGSKGPRTRSRGRAEASEALAALENNVDRAPRLDGRDGVIG